MNSYQVKPLGFGELSELLRELSTYWLAKNRLFEKELGDGAR